MAWEVHNELDNYDHMTYLDTSRPRMVLAEAFLVLDNDRITNQPNDPMPGIYIQNVTECAKSYCIQDHNLDHNLSVHNGDITLHRGSPDFGQLLAEVHESDCNLTRHDPCWAPSGTEILSDVEVSLTAIGDMKVDVNGSDHVFCQYDNLDNSTFTSTKQDYYTYDGTSSWSFASSTESLPANFARIYGTNGCRFDANRAAKYTVYRDRRCLQDGSHGPSLMAMADSPSVDGRSWECLPGFYHSYKQKEDSVEVIHIGNAVPWFETRGP